MRTYSRHDWALAQERWDDGGFSERWERVRRLAAQRGFIYPPQGTAFDQRDAETPSQRAIIWQALQDTPVFLEITINGSSSWSEVVAKVLAFEDRRRQEVAR